MQFKDVIGQDIVKQRLIASAKEQRVSHAQMFLGQLGYGTLPLAMAFAQYISCKNKGENDACGICSSCKKYSKLTHPDYHFVFPVFTTPKFKKPVSDNFIRQWREMTIKTPYFSLNQWLTFLENENAQGLIYESESASIIKKLSFKPFESDCKVMIIWLPEKMNLACANKLLKMIEEPPHKTYFLLVAENEERIISTIRSRVQKISVPPIESKVLTKALAQAFNLTEESAADIANLSKGDYIKALSYINEDKNTAFFFSKFQELMRLAYKRDVLNMIEWAEEMGNKSRDKQVLFFTLALNWTREYFMLNLNQPKINYLNHKELEWGKKFAPFINEKNIVALTNEFETGIKHISMNGNQRIIFLDTALRIVKLIAR